MSRKRRKAPDRAAPVSQPGPPGAARLTGGRKRALLVVLLIAVAGSAIAWWRLLQPSRFPPPPPPEQSRVAFDDFVGAAACRDCHAREYAAWSGSTHGRAGGPPTRERVLAAFDGRPIRFADAVVIPSVGPGGAFTFTVREYGAEPVTLTVSGVIGGGHMLGGGTQGYVSAFPDGTVRFLPFDFIRDENVWFCNTNSRTDRGWIPITPDVLLAECADWPPTRVLGVTGEFAGCQECHGSQIQLDFDSSAARYTTRFASLTINCESCHGPGRAHVAVARSGAIAGQVDIGMRSLATLPKDASLEICFQCHALKDVLQPGHLPGESLPRHYSLGFPVLGDRPLFADGRVATFAYQENHRYSACYLDGSMTCTDCHDPHSQGYRDIWGRRLESPFSDGQCLDCHASKAEQPERHTHHLRSSSGSRCVSCHMPYLQHPEIGTSLRFARSDHTIPIPRPAFDSSLGIVNACSQCHPGRSVTELEAQARAWYGEFKPHKPIVAALADVSQLPDARTAAEVLLDTTAGHPMAQIAALGSFVERFLRPDMAVLEEAIVQRLRVLAASDDPDLRSAALASLHLTRGAERSERQFLLRALRDSSAQRAVRDRWVLALGTFADGYVQSGELARAVVAYRKALEIAPDDAAVLRNLGLTFIYAQQWDSALVVVRRSLAADPSQSLGWVNLGVAFENRGQLDSAESAYRRALAIQPQQALAIFNLGNVELRRGDQAGALEWYERAAALDPTIPRVHVALAGLYAQRGELDHARTAAARGLRFHPDDDVLRRIAAELGVNRREE